MARPTGRLGWLILSLLWLASGFIWIRPLFRPRGVYGWGHYRLVDIYVGVPLVLVAICATVFVAGPLANRYKLTARLAALFLSVLITLLSIDLGYAFGVQGAWRKSVPTDVWFDSESITRENALPDNELGFVRKPFLTWEGRLSPEARYVTYRSDENGFRNTAGIKQADVVFIGDSFTEGASVPEENTFVRQLTEKSSLTVVNLGRGHYGPQQELEVLKRYGLAYDPRIVVWQLFEGNDLTDARKFAEWREKPVAESQMLRYTKRSLIVQLLSRTIAEDYSSTRPLQLRDGQTGRVFLDYKYIPDQPIQEVRGVSETTRALEEGYHLCQSRGIKLLVISVPIKVRVLGPYICFTDEGDRDSYLPDGKLDNDNDFTNELRRFCRKLECPFIDLTPALRGRARVDNRFVYALSQDSHLDVDGHFVVAAIIDEYLRSHEEATIAPQTQAQAPDKIRTK